MTEHEFTLADRIAKIQSINAMYDLEHNAYVSFSGGKDSTVLHYLIDEALPGNNIPRVFINTGIEYKLILQFVREMAERDSRFIIWATGKNIRETLEKYGYPFKSKEHAHKLWACKHGQDSKWIKNYFRVETINTFRQCPKKLMYQFEPSFTLNISDKCCFKFKKEPFRHYEKESGRYIALTGMMRAESGQRINLPCIVTTQTGKVTRFHPMSIVSPQWEKWYIESKSIKLALQVKTKRTA